MQVSTLLITPICPHTCEHIWRNILRCDGSALTAGFPEGSVPDFGLRCIISQSNNTSGNGHMPWPPLAQRPSALRIYHSSLVL